MKVQNILPPSVRKDDWAFLGAVRHADNLLVHLTKSANTLAKGILSLMGDKNLASLVSYKFTGSGPVLSTCHVPLDACQ